MTATPEPDGAAAPRMPALATAYDRISRYPVLFFGAVSAWIVAIWHVKPDTPVGFALGATVLFLQNAFSVSKKTADENAQGAAYVGAIEHQNVALAARALSRPLRAPAE